MELTVRDRKIAEHLRRSSVLQSIDNHCVKAERGLMLVTCADGDRFYNIFSRNIEVVLSQREDPRIHVFGWNGGALRLADPPPTPIGRLLRPRFGVGLIDPFEEIAAAREMKRIDTVALVVHAPCGYARKMGWDLIEVMRQLARAKDNLKTRLPGIKVKCYPHIHWGPGKDESYFTSVQGWKQYEMYLARDGRAVV